MTITITLPGTPVVWGRAGLVGVRSVTNRIPAPEPEDKLTGADLTGADLYGANLTGAIVAPGWVLTKGEPND